MKKLITSFQYCRQKNTFLKDFAVLIKLKRFSIEFQVRKKSLKIFNVVIPPTTAGTIKHQNLERHGENATSIAGLKWTKPVRR